MDKHKDELDFEMIISLMEVYQNEKMHRDDGFYTESFRFFYVTLVMIFLPNLADGLQFNFGNETLLKIISPLIGVVMSLIFLYVSLSNTAKIYAVGLSYEELNKMLPEEYQRKKVKDVKVLLKNDGKVFSKNILIILSFVMFGSLFIMGIVNFVFNLLSILN